MNRELRVKQARSRATVRAWQYRQRNHAHGTWFRLRRVLTYAERAYGISEANARQLLEAGFVAEEVGAALQPERTIVFVDEAALDRISDRRELRVALDADLLAAPALALVRFRS